jgi:hypothetical protein
MLREILCRPRRLITDRHGAASRLGAVESCATAQPPVSVAEPQTLQGGAFMVRHGRSAPRYGTTEIVSCCSMTSPD